MLCGRAKCFPSHAAQKTLAYTQATDVFRSLCCWLKPALKSTKPTTATPSFTIQEAHMNRAVSSRHAKASGGSSRHVNASVTSPSGRIKSQRLSASNLKAVPKKRADPNAPTYIVVGAVVGLVGLALAVGLAMTSPGAEGERNIALKFLPWLVVVGGIGLSVVGFLNLPKASERVK
jgi:hypothetical protein